MTCPRFWAWKKAPSASIGCAFSRCCLGANRFRRSRIWAGGICIFTRSTKGYFGSKKSPRIFRSSFSRKCSRASRAASSPTIPKNPPSLIRNIWRKRATRRWRFCIVCCSFFTPKIAACCRSIARIIACMARGNCATTLQKRSSARRQQAAVVGEAGDVLLAVLRVVPGD